MKRPGRWLERLQGAGFLLPAALTGALWLKGVHPTLPGWSCPLRAFTGIPCPTCFLTRATVAALHGELGESLRLHAFGPPLAALLLVWSALALWQKRPLPRGWRLELPAAGALAAALLAYWLGRLLLGSFPAG
jgi:hypothetical protein